MFPKLLFVGGKGGVGKSTISGSLACNLADLGKKTLLISTDPAHNLNDLFQVQLSSKITALHPYLSVLQIDPYVEVQHYIQSIARECKTLVGANHYEMIDRYYQSAAQNGITQESALFDRLIRLVVEEEEEWDHLIVDTAPTGHTLRLFTLAQTLKTWSQTLMSFQDRNVRLQNLVGTQESSPLLERLQNRYALYTQFQALLKDKYFTSIVFVLNPDLLCIEETSRALEVLQKEGIEVLALAVNKIFPPSQEAFFRHRYQIQEKYLEKIHAMFASLPQWEIPFLDQDILKEKQLKKILDFLFK